MSYARFGWDGSDVYIFLDVGGFINCCGCQFGNDGFGSYHAYSTEDMITHLWKHQNDGDHVPEDVFDNLWLDHEDNMEFIKTGNLPERKWDRKVL